MITVLRQVIIPIVCEVEWATEDKIWATLTQGQKPSARGPSGCILWMGSPFLHCWGLGQSCWHLSKTGWWEWTQWENWAGSNCAQRKLASSISSMVLLNEGEWRGSIHWALNACHEWCRAGVLNLRDPMPDDLRWTWYNSNRNIGHNKCNAFESSPNHPYLLVPGKIVFHETGPWCQNGWGAQV